MSNSISPSQIRSSSRDSSRGSSIGVSTVVSTRIVAIPSRTAVSWYRSRVRTALRSPPGTSTTTSCGTVHSAPSVTGPSGSGTTTRSPVLEGGQGRSSRRLITRPLRSTTSRESGTPRLAFTCSYPGGGTSSPRLLQRIWPRSLVLEVIVTSSTECSSVASPSPSTDTTVQVFRESVAVSVD